MLLGTVEDTPFEIMVLLESEDESVHGRRVPVLVRPLSPHP